MGWRMPSYLGTSRYLVQAEQKTQFSRYQIYSTDSVTVLVQRYPETCAMVGVDCEAKKAAGREVAGPMIANPVSSSTPQDRPMELHCLYTSSTIKERCSTLPTNIPDSCAIFDFFKSIEERKLSSVLRQISPDVVSGIVGYGTDTDRSLSSIY